MRAAARGLAVRRLANPSPGRRGPEGIRPGRRRDTRHRCTYTDVDHDVRALAARQGDQDGTACRPSPSEWRVISRGCIPDYSGMSYVRLTETGGLQWPFTAAKPDGTVRLYEERTFPTSLKAPSGSRYWINRWPSASRRFIRSAKSRKMTRSARASPGPPCSRRRWCRYSRAPSQIRGRIARRSLAR